MTKELETFQQLRKAYIIAASKDYNKVLDDIEKQLKALEIIKECKEVIDLQKAFDEELYTPEEIEKEGGQNYYLTDGSDGCRRYKITKEQYGLLKEMLL